MKQILIRIILIAGLGWGPSPVWAQNCDGYFPHEHEGPYEMSSYNPKGKLTGINTYEVLGRNVTADGLEYQIKANISDAKGKNTTEAEYTATCTGEGILLDMKTKLSPEMMGPMASMEVEFQGDALQIPNMLSVGQKLPDASLSGEASGSPITMRLHFNITQREVVAKETIETEAGSFECFKLAYQFDSKVGIIKVQGKIEEWHAKGVGIVMSKTYNKKGKLMGSSRLTKW